MAQFKNTLDEIKATGAHYTPRELAEFVAAQIIHNCKIRSPVILDPACGDGELLLAIKKQCPDAQINGFDLDGNALAMASGRIDGNFEKQDFLLYSGIFREDDLFGTVNNKYDIIIANPPYIRTQVLGAKRAREIARRFELSGRVDIYFAFLEGIADALNPGGLAGVIVSNRFMTTKSGGIVRERILARFDILHVWDLGDTRLFKAAVLPAVLLLRKKNGAPAARPRMTSIYSIKSDKATHLTASSQIEALSMEGIVMVGQDAYMVRQGNLDFSDNVWRIACEYTSAWLASVRARTYCTFGDIGKIRVGVKTTADKIFVQENWTEPRPELLKPLVTHHVAKRYKANPPDREILYPHAEANGKKEAVSLDDFPISKAYLEIHRKILEGRNYVIEAGRKWYEIWVPQRPALWSAPKLVFPDIAEEPTFWMSLNDEIIQGDCYWITAEGEKTEWLWLALAVGNSKFTEEFYDHSFHNKLYAGRRRFMTQYVEKFPLPDPYTKLAGKIISMAKSIYSNPNAQASRDLARQLDSSIYKAFGMEKAVG